MPWVSPPQLLECLSRSSLSLSNLSPFTPLALCYTLCHGQRIVPSRAYSSLYLSKPRCVALLLLSLARFSADVRFPNNFDGKVIAPWLITIQVANRRALASDTMSQDLVSSIEIGGESISEYGIGGEAATAYEDP